MTRHFQVRLGLLALLAMFAVCCGRSKAPTKAPSKGAGKTPTTSDAPAKAKAAQAKPTLQADAQRPLGAALTSGKTPVDVLLRSFAPAQTAKSIEDAAGPLTRALEGIDGVSRVVSRAETGELRVMIRFKAGTSAPQASAKVREAWASMGPKELSSPVIGAIARGQRAVSAWTLIHAEGPKSGTSWLEESFVSKTLALPATADTWIAGANHAYQLVQWMPPYLKRNQIGFGAAAATLKRALRGGTTKLKTALTEPVRGGAKPVKLSDLSVRVQGVGEPVRQAWTGTRQVVACVVESAAADAADAGPQVTPLTRKPKLPKGSEHFLHPLSVMWRFRLTLPRGKTAETQKLLIARINGLMKGGRFHDVFMAAGADGVPSSLQPEAVHGRTWTLWLAGDLNVPIDEVYSVVRGALGEGGWTVTPLDEADDTGLRWTLRHRSTELALFASRDIGLLQSRMASVINELATERRVQTRETGPRKIAALASTRTLRRDVAAAKGVHSADLRWTSMLKKGLVYIGRSAEGPVWMGLPTGVMATRQLELPMRAKSGVVLWSALTQVDDESTTTPRLRTNQRPLMWYGVIPSGSQTFDFRSEFWSAVEQMVSPSSRLDLFASNLELKPLSVAAPGK